ncbi:hypothetical protein ACT8ZV_05650 [Nocardioides sp. MAHUQ-72]|uniref:hypothetical protein n=1 Tax=unclassified Nocardioides TaxID=2615069 RepID=UPI00361626D1
MTHGVAFPAQPDGRRSTTAVGRGVVADALRAVDPVGARAVEHETSWRSRYPLHFRRLVEAGLADPGAWLAIADAGLASVHRRMVVVGEDDREAPLSSLADAAAARALETVEVAGEGTPADELVVPYRGRSLRGAELREQLADWRRRGVMEPSAAEAVAEVAGNPGWLRLDGQTVAVLGAGSEMGPLRPLLGWGATVAAVDLPRAAMWDRVLRTARSSAGRLLVPVRADAATPDRAGEAAGLDLLDEVPETADWLTGLDGRLVLGNYLYADGGTHVRVSVAADALASRVDRARPDTALAFLATPTDVFAVPRDAVEQATRSYRGRSATARTLGRPLRWATRGRLLHRAYPPDADPGIGDSLVPVQGPSYALAKRIQRWRAAAARRDGRQVSFHVAPSTRTHSVVKNRALAAAFAGAHRFGVEIFEPATSNTLMAALLVHDLVQGTPSHDHPWQDEAYAAVHGGLWRAPYEPRSALGLAAVLGYASARS